MAEILLVEDSSEYQKIVLRTLGHHQVVCAKTGEEALSLLQNRHFSLVLLDIHLPYKDGYSVLSEIQADPKIADIPVICLTGKSQVTDKITAFSLGADDYIVKPFDPLELRARIDAKLSKALKLDAKSKVVKIDDIEIDHGSHRVFIHGNSAEEIFLTPTEFKLLAHLARRPEQVFSREQLLTAAWGDDSSILVRAVDVHLCSLRKKLGSRSKSLKAVPGVGYKFSSLKKKTLKKAA
ncbi:MAG: response regulator transcription factor [Pseudobdellovibrionaceae bacterium]